MIEDWDDDFHYDTPALDNSFHEHEMDVDDASDAPTCDDCDDTLDGSGYCPSCRCYS